MGKIHRVGIIGCGKVARHHMAAYQNLPNATLVAVCDMDRAKAEALTSRASNMAVCTDVDQLCAAGVEVASVCTPHPEHWQAAQVALERGVHVIVEKPIAASLADADRMIAAALASGVKLSVIFQRRFWPAVRRAREAVDQGHLGRLILGDCAVKWRRDQAYYESAPWRGTWNREGGGVLMNQAVHALDTFRWLMGPVDSVHARAANFTHAYVDVEDTVVATMQFSSGALGTLIATLCVDPPVVSQIHIHGDNGSSVGIRENGETGAGGTSLWNVRGWPMQADWQLEGQMETGMPMFHQMQLADFLGAIEEDRDPLVTAASGRASLELILAIYASWHTGEQIQLPLPADPPLPQAGDRPAGLG